MHAAGLEEQEYCLQLTLSFILCTAYGTKLPQTLLRLSGKCILLVNLAWSVPATFVKKLVLRKHSIEYPFKRCSIKIDSKKHYLWARKRSYAFCQAHVCGALWNKILAVSSYFFSLLWFDVPWMRNQIKAIYTTQQNSLIHDLLNKVSVDGADPWRTWGRASVARRTPNLLLP